MVTTATLLDTRGVNTHLQTATGELLQWRQVLDQLKSEYPFSEALVVSSLPRGGLQIIQPTGLPDAVMRNYAREMHAHDRLTWQAVSLGQPVRAETAWQGEEFEQSRYYQEFMQASGFRYAAAAPLSSPLLEGYPGAIHFYRDSSQGAFTSEDLLKLGEFARELDAAIVRIRNARSKECETDRNKSRAPAVRLFIVDSQLRAPLQKTDPSSLDAQLRDHLLGDAMRRFEHVNGHDTADRVSLPDSHGDLWNFRVALHRSYPALGTGAFVFYCLQPSCSDWSSLRTDDFAADPEIMRLLPAMTFMSEQFQRGPTLIEIAKTVHLSPFHFHRRFTELLGITPKHFLLDCQIEQAKNDLMAREKDLLKIASECGFAHQSHFTSRFKQATGLTPTRWRRMALEVAKESQN